MITAAPRILDCDVHVAVSSGQVLLGYLPDQWAEYFEEIGFREPPGVAYTMPRWSAISGTDPRAVTLEQLRTNVLGASTLAIVNCYYGVEGPRHPFLASALASAVNRWVEAEWLARDEHLLASVIVAPHDAETAAQEINRVASDRRFVQVLFPARAWEPYGNRRYWPIYEAAQAHGLPVAIHAGGATGVLPTPVGELDNHLAEYAAAAQLPQSHLASLIAEGVFDTFPDLRVCLLESGVTWITTLLWKMDTEWKALRREIPWVKRPPSEYVAEHVRFTVEPLDAPNDPRVLTQILDDLCGVQLLLYASDYPRRASLPGLMETFTSLLTPDQLELMRWGNAYHWYAMAERGLPDEVTA